jgi:endonuclease/exonuclease/phosphatase family metal-dependent hydrolase
VRTSRNALLPLRRAIAARAPDLLKSNGGGANAILARVPVLEHRTHRLRRLPERRVCHGIRVAGGWVVNVHAHNHRPELARADVDRALAAARCWAAGAPLLFGGDLNLRHPQLPGLVHLAGNHVDHVLAAGWSAAGPGAVLDRGTLSDHPPVTVALA